MENSLDIYVLFPIPEERTASFYVSLTLSLLAISAYAWAVISSKIL